MRVLIVAPNRERIVHPVPPLGPLYLSSLLKQRGHEVRIVDLMFSQTPMEDVEKNVREFEPQVAGISIRNIDTLFSKNVYALPALKDCARRIRALCDAPLVLGGPSYSIFPRQLSEALGADFGFVGESDRSFPEFVDRLAAGRDVADLPGLVYKKGDRLVLNPHELIPDLDFIPHQDIAQVDARKYGRYRGCLGVFTRRGCPMQCIYCPDSLVHGRAPRLRSARIVVDEIEHLLEKTGVPYFDFADSLFNQPREHMMRVCQELVDRKVKIQFEVELNPVGQDEESVKLLKAAGCLGVDLTADSGSDVVLRNMGKGFTARDVMRVADLYAKHNICYTVGFILGGPGENLETLNESLAMADSLPKMASSYFAVAIRVYADTALARHMKEKNPALPDDLMTPVFFSDPAFDAECMERLIEIYRGNLRFNLPDLMYEGNLAASMRFADWSNVRPLWKAGKLPRIMEIVRNLGRPNIGWDAERRRFTVGA